MALGICDALRDAELLANAIEDGLGARRPIDQALADYERRRNEASAADFDENVALARFRPLRPDVLAIRAAVRERPEEATRFVKARMGMTDLPRFSIRRISSSSWPERSRQ
jgi:2-polyprenyl-6-methoxyphenol hydroxylase-like FAD-dependent oxidoreductase